MMTSKKSDAADKTADAGNRHRPIGIRAVAAATIARSGRTTRPTDGTTAPVAKRPTVQDTD